MAIPSVPMFSNAPGGGLVAALKGINALHKDLLESKYYGPNILSEINNRNSLTQGKNIENKYMPEKLRLKNVLAELQNEYYGPNILSEINNRNSLTENNKINNKYLPEKLRLSNNKQQFNNDNPLFNQPGVAGQVGSLIWLNKLKKEDPIAYKDMMEFGIYPDENKSNNYNDGQSFISPISQNNYKQPNNNLDPASILLRSLNQKNNIQPTKEFKNAQGYEDAKEGYVPFTNRTTRINNEEQKQYFMNALNPSESHKSIEQHQKEALARKHWDALTPETKAHLVAIGQGAGIRGDEIEKELSSGKSFDDLLYEHGYDPDNPPEPIYELSSKNRSALNEREYASREVKYLSNFITKATGEYANKIKQYSPNQVKDALLGKNDEQQAKFLAARGLSPELINLRLVLGGARGTVHAIQSMADKSMLNNKIFESLVSNNVWKRTQEIMDDELQKAFKASKKGYGAPKIKESNKSQKPVHEMTTEEIRAELGE
jgi:hypothetical protein